MKTFIKFVDDRAWKYIITMRRESTLNLNFTFFREVSSIGIKKIVKSYTKDNPADALTKVAPESMFEFLIT